jgi:hypothetical protein
MVARVETGLPPDARWKDEPATIREVMAFLRARLGHMGAPPTMDRNIGLQELETILCKWKSHQNGHYPLDNDLVEIRHGAEPWLEHSELAREFLHWMPAPGQVSAVEDEPRAGIGSRSEAEETTGGDHIQPAGHERLREERPGPALPAAEPGR